MVLPLSPVVANMYMEHFKGIASSSNKPKLWIRHVSDNFIIWIQGYQRLHLLTHTNNIGPIKFAREKKDNNTLPFLYVLSTRGNLDIITSVYKKPTYNRQSSLIFEPCTVHKWSYTNTPQKDHHDLSVH